MSGAPFPDSFLVPHAASPSFQSPRLIRGALGSSSRSSKAVRMDSSCALLFHHLTHLSSAPATPKSKMKVLFRQFLFDLSLSHYLPPVFPRFCLHLLLQLHLPPSLAYSASVAVALAHHHRLLLFLRAADLAALVVSVLGTWFVFLSDSPSLSRAHSLHLTSSSLSSLNFLL